MILPSGKDFPQAGYESIVDWIVRKAPGNNWSTRDAADDALEGILEWSPYRWGLHTIDTREDAEYLVKQAEAEASGIVTELKNACRSMLLARGFDAFGLGYW